MVEEIKKYAIGTVLFTIIIVCGVTLIGIMKSNDNTFASGEDFKQFNKSFNKLNDVTKTSSELKNRIESNETLSLGLFGVINALAGSAWNTLKITFSSFSFMTNAISDIPLVFGEEAFPSWVGSLIISIIIIVIAFAIYKALFKVT